MPLINYLIIIGIILIFLGILVTHFLLMRQFISKGKMDVDLVANINALLLEQIKEKLSELEKKDQLLLEIISEIKTTLERPSKNIKDEANLPNLPRSENRIDVFEPNCKLFKLTPTEIEIAQLIRQGKKHMDIADSLFIEESTVKKHTQNIFKKVDVVNKVELIHKLSGQVSLYV